MIALNSSMFYWVGFLDPAYNFITINPNTVPRTLYGVRQGSTLVYIYIEVVEHILINREESPCESSEDYIFGDCVNEKVARDVGCQTFWTNFTDLDTCSDEASIVRLINRHVQIQEMERNKLEKLTGCLKPCVYTEYRVTQHV